MKNAMLLGLLGLALTTAHAQVQDTSIAQEEATPSKYDRKNPTAEHGLTTSAQQDFLRARRQQLGEGTSKNVPEAIALYRKAADAGHAAAAFSLGMLLLEGKETAADPAAALALFKQAAERGLMPANYNLGVMYAQGLGTPVNFEAARQAYGLAAEAGDSKAQYNLGALLFEGKGGKQDAEQAWVWFTLAGREIDSAKNAVAFIESKLKPEQLASARTRAASWKSTQTKAQ